MSELPPLIGRYEIISRLGQGGMGSLYLAKDPKIGRLVAIKLVRQEFDSPEARQRFAREAQSAGTLRHPNIVTIFDVDEHDGLPFIAMEYVDGETLGELIRRKAPVPLTRRLEWIEALCAGLAYAHRQGVVHRDIKPANLMLDAEGALKILDFGLARRETTKFTQSHVIIGTPNYMSPEQIRAGDIGPPSDVFAVGAVLYEVVAYTEAFPGNIHQAMHKIVNEAPTPLESIVSGIDPHLVAIVQRALEKDVARRYQDLAVMKGELGTVRERLESGVSDGATMPLPGRAFAGFAPANQPGAGNQTPSPSERTGSSKRSVTNRVSLQKRRVAQIESHVAAAREAFADGAIDKAREAAEQALMFDPDYPAAHQLLDDIAREEERRQIEQLVTAARAALQRGQLTAAEQHVADALAIAPQHPQVMQLRETIDRTRVELERARQVQETLRRARGQFAETAFEAALRTAGEVLAIDPDNHAARDLQARAREAIDARDQKKERDAAAEAAVTEARELFARGDKQAAIAKLEAFTPPHDLVSAFLASIRIERTGTDRMAPIPMPTVETARFAPGRTSDGPHVASNQKPMLIGVAVAATLLIVALAYYVMNRDVPAGPDQAGAGVSSPEASAKAVSPGIQATADLPGPAEEVKPAPAAASERPPTKVGTPPALAAVESAASRDLLEAYRLLGLGDRAGAEKIAAQLRRRDAKSADLAKLSAAIKQVEDREKAAAAAATPAPPPAAQPEEPKVEPVFSVLPGGGFAARSEPVAPPNLAELEGPGIEQAIRFYEKALSAKDLKAVSRVRTFTQEEQRNWVRVFDRVRTYRLVVDIVGAPDVNPNGREATIAVRERVQQVDRNGFEINQAPRDTVYRLEKIGGQWRILPPK